TTKSDRARDLWYDWRNPRDMILEAAPQEGDEVVLAPILQREGEILTRSIGGDVLLPPSNFGVVDRGIYRSGFPSDENFPFLKALNVRSIVYLCPEPYPKVNAEFVRSQGIRLFQFGIEGSRESLTVSNRTIMEALRVLLGTEVNILFIAAYI
ncbi:hypothetical protein BHE74_00018047, partial [Ensete ventricosum]